MKVTLASLKDHKTEQLSAAIQVIETGSEPSEVVELIAEASFIRRG